MNNKYACVFSILAGILVFIIIMYFKHIGYDAYEARVKTAEVFWIMGILGYIGIRGYHFIKERN